jgi:biotin--protein ligase
VHSDQKVTLTSTTPHQALVIKTITLDYGLLRCVPDKTAGSALPRSSMYDGGSEDRSYSPLSAGMQSLGISRAQTGNFVDLQPDGNSFDLMSGLIKRKV